MILSVPSPARSCMPQARRVMRPSRSLQPSRRPVVIRCLQQLGTSLPAGGRGDHPPAGRGLPALRARPSATLFGPSKEISRRLCRTAKRS